VQNRRLTFPLGNNTSKTRCGYTTQSTNLTFTFTVSELADTLAELLVPYSTSPDKKYRVAQYSPCYRLAFTLLNEDAAAGSSIIGWDISDAITREFTYSSVRRSLPHKTSQAICLPSSTSFLPYTTSRSRVKSNFMHPWHLRLASSMKIPMV
jgi:Phosphatidylinositol-glycan biosynthesis class S protein.